MTTYAPTFTPRLRVKYKCGGIAHSMQVRGPRGATLATMGGLVDPIANCFVALATYLYSDFSWISAEAALTDEESFAPVAVSGIIPVGGVPLVAQSAVNRIRGLTISGRAPGSRRAGNRTVADPWKSVWCSLEVDARKRSRPVPARRTRRSRSSPRWWAR